MTRHVFVSGAGRGIGLSFVEYLLQQEYKVWATYRTPDKAMPLLSLAEKNNNLTVAQLDICDVEQLTRLANEWQRIRFDWIINNAGIYGPKSITFQDIDTDVWLDVFKTNTIAPYQVTRAFYSNLLKSNERKIAFLTSKMGSIEDNSSGGNYLYRSSKSALNQVVKSLSIDSANDEVSVLALHPGWVKTSMGGANALISSDVSVSGLATVIECVNIETSGQFWNYDGQLIPW